MFDEKKFKDVLNEEDLKFFAMTNDEFNERADRLAYKALNGIIDEETIAATERTHRNWVLLYGKEEAERLIAADKEVFK